MTFLKRIPSVEGVDHLLLDDYLKANGGCRGVKIGVVLRIRRNQLLGTLGSPFLDSVMIDSMVLEEQKAIIILYKGRSNRLAML